MPSWVERARAAVGRSVWMPVGLRLTGIAVLMLGLAAVGASSVVSASRGASVPSTPPGPLESGIGPVASASSSAAPSAEARGRSGEAESGSVPRTSPVKTSPSAGVTADGKVILNRATVGELTRLPGVGVKRAEAIVRLRDRLKRFRRVTDLLRVRGIGPKTLRRMRPHLVLDEPARQAPPKPPPAPSATHP